MERSFKVNASTRSNISKLTRAKPNSMGHVMVSPRVGRGNQSPAIGGAFLSLSRSEAGFEAKTRRAVTRGKASLLRKVLKVRAISTVRGESDGRCLFKDNLRLGA